MKATFRLWALSLLMAGCANLSGDAKLQRELAGTWVAHWGTDMSTTTTNIIAANGSFESHIRGPKGGRADYQGMFLVKNGAVDGKAVVAGQKVVMHLHIMQLDNNELVWSNDDGLVEPAFHKVTK